jgi:signal transduction histidine kinase
MTPGPLDVLLAAAVVAVEIVGTLLLVDRGVAGRPLDALGYLLLIGHGASLVVRRHYPVPVLLWVALTSFAFTALDYPGPLYTVALVFAVWTAVAAGDRITAIGVTALLLIAQPTIGLVFGVGHLVDLEGTIWFTGWLVAGFVLGEVSRGRRERLAQLEGRALDAERTREEEARRRAGEERLRIARELHDVLAHHISVINVQAGVAVHLLDKQPDQARSALVAINEASKEAMRELRATLGVLRQVDDAEPRHPSPGLARLDDLVANAAAAGLDVSVDVSGEPRRLGANADLAAYRIVQEALTNVVRHAGSPTASVSIRYSPREVEIEVDDQGRGRPGGVGVVAGNGLIGMQERANAAGGELVAGPGSDGGFRVRARLPLEGGT